MSQYTQVVKNGRVIITHPDKLGKIEIIGNGHIRETFYALPDWKEAGEEEEEAFTYKGEVYFLSEFMRVERTAPEWMRAYDGYHNDSFFSGILVKFAESDYGDYGVKAYTFIA